MYSFGAGREAYDRVYYKERIPHDRQIPGPGTYEARLEPGKDAKKFSLLSRIATESHIAVKSTTPGPGHYKESLRIAPDGLYPLSTIPNAKVP